MHTQGARIAEPNRHRHPPAHPARRFGSASLDATGIVRGCDEVWEREVGVPVGTCIDTAVCAADVPYLRQLLGQTDDGLSIAVRTGHRDSDVTVLLHLEGAFRNDLWHVIGMPTFQPRHTGSGPLHGESASFDVLTGLLDRRAFEQVLADTLRRCALGDNAALLLLDLDGFKHVNDTYGHAIGDQLLRAVGDRIAAALRDGDRAARFGGDEFAIVIRRATQLDARIAAERMLSAVQRARITEFELMAGVETSIGLVLLRAGEDVSPEEALSRADVALYHAKGERRGGVAEYPTGDIEAAVRMRTRMSWGQRLHRALERDQLEVHAQPIVRLRDGLPVAEELSLQLHDGDDRLPLDVFLEHALRAGLVTRIDQWLLRRLVELAADSGLPLTAGVSGAVLVDRSLTARLHNDLVRAGVDPARIVLQLRDSGLVADLPLAQESAHGLRRLGVGLALDAFGTRTGTLTALRELPFSQLRLAPVFSTAGGGVFDDTVVAYAVEVGAEFGLDVIATGITAPADVTRLIGLGVELGQGLLFDAPRLPEQTRTGTLADDG
jgi:diguanylate cyclase (GGDEF)-like protein